MKHFKILLLVLLLSALPLSQAWGYGWNNWYGGYYTTTATSWNGWTYTSYSVPSWGWNAGAYASAYTDTYPYADYDIDYGWPSASATASSSNSGRSAYAHASTYSPTWAWWGGYGGYTNSVAKTSGYPSYASASASPSSYWSYHFRVPRSWWYNTWTPTYGWHAPFWLRYYYWGWLDGEGDNEALRVLLNAVDIDEGTEETLLDDGFWEKGGTIEQIGTTFDVGDLVWDPDVSGEGDPGWNIMGHDGGIETDDPYELTFLISVDMLDENACEDWIDLEAVFHIDGMQGSTVVPEPGTLCFLVGGGLMLSLLTLLRRRGGKA